MGRAELYVKWKSSLVSHFPPPAVLWPCCIGEAPALAAIQRPPALPDASAEHPNEKIRVTCSEGWIRIALYL